MTASIAEVVAQLRAAADQLDTAAVTATRAQADAEQAHGHFTEAGRGSNHADIRAATAESQTAAAKAGKVGRLMAQAADRLIAYANHIAPGSAPSRTASDAATPTGDDIVRDAESRVSKGEAFLRRHIRRAEDTEGKLQNTEKAVTTGLREIFQQNKGPGGTTTTTSTAQPKPPPAERPQMEHPVTSVIMAAGAVAVAVKGTWNMIKKRRERKHDGNQP